MDAQKEISYDAPMWTNFDEWIAYYRANIHRFATEYFELDLKDFQKILLYGMDSQEMTKFTFFASRGIGKSWLTMVYALCKGTLYPNISIKVAAPTIDQAKKLIQKVEALARDYPNIAREILDYKSPKDYACVRLRSGTVIETVVAGPNARGGRCQVLICDEIRQMDKKDVKDVLELFMTETRRPPYLKNPKYSHLVNSEPNKKIYLTSIGYKDEWIFKDYMDDLDRMLNGDKRYKVISVPYQFGIKGGIIDRGFMETQAIENKENIESFRMEVEVIPYGETEFAMFKYSQVNNARRLILPIVPPTDKEYMDLKGDLKKHPLYQRKQDGEIRVLSMDIAIAAGRTNDNSVYVLFRLFNDGDHYLKDIPYIEAVNGMSLDDQVVKLKRMFYDLECDYVVVDAGGGLGLSAIDSIGRKTYDRVRNRYYPGWRTANRNDKIDARIKDPNAQAVMFTIQVAGAGASSLQYDMLLNAQLEFERNNILLLTREEDAINELNARYDYLALKTSNDAFERERATMMYTPFVNTSALINECITTQMVKTKSDRWTFDEGKGRKDRVICMIYGLYIISQLEKDLDYNDAAIDISEYFTSGSSNYSSKAHNTNPFFGRAERVKGFGRR